MKSFIKKILKLFGYQINKSTTDICVIYPNDFAPIKNNDENFSLYTTAMEKSENASNNEFPKQMRFYSLIQIVKYILNKNEVSDFAECGCWKGHSSYIISKLIEESKKQISFHIFDSFEGLSKPTIEDKELFYKDAKTKKQISAQFSSSEKFVKDKVLKGFNFVKTYKGWIPNRFNEVKNKNFSLVHIDVDLYKPTLSSLEFFFPKLSKGGVIVCDDYNASSFPGANGAWDQYFKNKDYKFFFQNPLGGCFIIK